MKKILLILMLFLPWINCISQTRYDLYWDASPDYSHRKFDKPDLIITDEAKPRITLSTSIKAGVYIVDNFQIISGLQFAEKGYDILVESSNTIIRYHFYYLEVPVLCKYSIGIKNVHVSPVVGVTNGLCFGRKTYDSLFGHKTSAFFSDVNCNFFNCYDLSLHTGLELSYWINEAIAIKIEPKYVQSLTPLSDYFSLVNEYLYSYGMNVGIIYKIQKQDFSVEE